jgi:hypothetical protein
MWRVSSNLRLPQHRITPRVGSGQLERDGSKDRGQLPSGPQSGTLRLRDGLRTDLVMKFPDRRSDPCAVCHKCAVPFDPVCANSLPFNTIVKRFRAGLIVRKPLTGCHHVEGPIRLASALTTLCWNLPGCCALFRSQLACGQSDDNPLTIR